MPPALDLAASLVQTVAQGRALARESATMGAELVRIGLGTSEIAPDVRDGRFADPTWRNNPAYRRIAQTYLAACRAADHLVDNLEEDWQKAERARFVMNIVTSAAAPTNTVPGNPAAIKRAFETGGRSLRPPEVVDADAL